MNARTESVSSIAAVPNARHSKITAKVLNTSYRFINLSSSKKGEAAASPSPISVLTDYFLPVTGIHAAQSVHANAIG